MTASSLERLREDLKRIDEAILRLLNERAARSVEIGRVKHSLGLEVYDPAQESRVLESLQAGNRGPLGEAALRDIFREILSSSRALQAPLTVAYLGPEGSFSHLAARGRFGGGQDDLPEESRFLSPGGGAVVICVSLSAGTMESALEQMAAGFCRAGLVELRMDRIADPDLPSLLRAKRGPVLVTNRRREEGGSFTGTEEERVSLLCEAVRLGAEYVDLEIATEDRWARRILETAAERGRRTRVIVSFHDLQGTPSERTLRQRWRACRQRGGDIVKIVTHARRPEDNLRLLSLIPYSRRRGQDIIAFCMGEQGRISRIAAPLLGSALAFAALKRGEETAPGQWTVGEMKRILEALTASASPGRRSGAPEIVGAEP